MKLNNNFHEIFKNKPIIGMIHLAGENPVEWALEEIDIFEEEGIDAALIENYYGTESDVIKTLEEIKDRPRKIIMGINILPNEFSLSFILARRYEAKFIQIDYVAGKYEEGALDISRYSREKIQFPELIVLGGVHPKYYRPLPSSNLENELREGIQRAEAIVVTGQGTGKETSLDKIKYFRQIIGNHPLIVGAGVNLKNAYEQLKIADGAIVGTSLKVKNNTKNKVDRLKVRDLMTIVKEVRKL